MIIRQSCIAIQFNHPYYYLFDSHSCGSDGVHVSDGKAAIFIHNSIISLINNILKIYGTNLHSEITPIEFSLLSQHRVTNNTNSRPTFTTNLPRILNNNICWCVSNINRLSAHLKRQQTSSDRAKECDDPPPKVMKLPEDNQSINKCRSKGNDQTQTSDTTQEASFIKDQ